MKVPILRVRDDDGKVIDIPAIVGPRGEPGIGMENLKASDVKTADGNTVEVQLAELRQGYGFLPSGTDIASLLGSNGWWILSADGGYANLPSGLEGWAVLTVKDKTAMLYQMNESRLFYTGHVGFLPASWAEIYTTVHPPTAKEVGAVADSLEYTADANIELQDGAGRVVTRKYSQTTQNTPASAGLTNYVEGIIVTYSYTPMFATQICIPAGENATYMRSVAGGQVSEWEQR